jgi:hypothetical protein
MRFLSLAASGKLVRKRKGRDAQIINSTVQHTDSFDFECYHALAVQVSERGAVVVVGNRG